MRAQREEMPVRQQARGAYAAFIGLSVLIVAVLAYFALRDSADSVTEAPLAVSNAEPRVPADAGIPVEPMPAANAPVAAPVVASDVVAPDFVARELAPPRVAVGVGEAPVVQRENNDDFFVISGELLEKLEAEAPPQPVIE